MDFRDNGFPIDGKLILIDGAPANQFSSMGSMENRFSSMGMHGKLILIDGDPWELNPGPLPPMRAAAFYNLDRFNIQILLYTLQRAIFSQALNDDRKLGNI